MSGPGFVIAHSCSWEKQSRGRSGDCKLTQFGILRVQSAKRIGRATYGGSMLPPFGIAALSSGSVLYPLLEESSQTKPARSVLVVVIGPRSDLSVFNAHDRCALERNWQTKLHRTEGHYFSCRNFPLSNHLVPAFEGRDYLECGFWEELTSFAKEFTQALFVGELEFECLIVKCEAVVKSINYFRKPPVTQSS